MEDTLKCKNCGYEPLEPHWTICPKCNQPVKAEPEEQKQQIQQKRCRRCNEELDDDMDFCPACGERVTEAEPPVETAAKPAVAEKPEAKTPATVKTPAAKKPAVAKKSAAKKPVAAKKPAAKKPTAKKPTAKKPAAKKPAVQKPTATNKPAGENQPDNCFITTAVCETFSKPDDCYELTMFRNFRDNWLAKQSEGGELISRYYRIAPGIVASINQSPDRAAVYANIRDNYLGECLRLIESGQFNDCKNLYVKMVTELEKAWG